MPNWKEYKLGDIVEDVAMGPFGSNLKVDNFIGSGVPVIRGANLNAGGFKDELFVFVSEEKAQSLKRSLACPDDLVFTHRGTIGQVGIIPHSKYPYYLVSQSQMRLTVNKQFLNPRFLYYWFQSATGQYELLKNSAQVGVPSIASPTKSLKEIDIKLPDVFTQTAIAEILTSLDDKIELNNQINQQLEALAQALFKRWFIDFEFPNENGQPYKSSGGEMVESELGDIPKGWEIRSLDQIAEYLNGLALQKYPTLSDKDYLPVIKIKELRNGITDSTDKASTSVPNKYIIENGDVLFSWSGSLMIDFWTYGKGALNQHLFKVSSEDYPKWFYYLWTHHHLEEFVKIAESKATTMGHIQRHHLSDAKVLTPSKRELQTMSGIVEPVIDESIELRLENNSLKQLRDTLLPKLISGELEVNQLLTESVM